MNKSTGVVYDSQFGRVKLIGIIGLQLMAAVIIIAAAYLAFFHFRNIQQAQIEADLLAVSELKTYQLTDYLRERMGDAELLVQRPAVWSVFDRQSRPNGPGTSEIPNITSQLKKAYGYSSVSLFDANLNLIYPSPPEVVLQTEVTAALNEARKSGNPQFVDLHLHEGIDAHMGIVYPVGTKGKLDGPLVGFLLLQLPAHPNLNRLITSWPTVPSSTGESIMIRVDNDQITYLSPLRFEPGARPLLTKRGLDNKKMLASKAASGQIGVVHDGIDYRGNSVLGAATKITGTPWILITKIDRDEAYENIHSIAKTIGFLTFCFLLISTFALYFFWRSRISAYELQNSILEQERDHASQQFSAERLRRNRIEARFSRIFDESPLPKQIHSIDDLSIVAINRAHERLFGYGLEEISRLDDWLNLAYPDTGIRDALYRQWLQDIAKARESNEVIESPEMQMRCKDGSIRVISGNMSIADDNIIIIWSDLTDLRRSEEALIESERRFRGMVEQTISGFYVVVDNRVAYINPQVTEMTGWRPEDVIGHTPDEFVDEQSVKELIQAQERLSSGQRTVTININVRRKDGTILPMAAHSTLGSWDGRSAVVAILEDLTERTRAEEKIRNYVRQLETSMRSALEACAKMVELRDPYTAGHQDRVGKIASAISREMGWSEKDCNAMELMGLVHDIGKVAVPAEFLTKPTRLSAYEFEIIKNHAQAGYEILKGLQFEETPVAEIVRQHHERMDGSGYPQGLKGDQILPEARVLAVADVLESMASYRPYRPALGIDKALEELEKNSGRLYDAEAVAALVRLVREKHYALP